jgi:hypothetical protein
MKQRPSGVTMWSIFAITLCLIQLYAYLRMPYDFMGLLNICIATSFLISGIFLLRLKNWARILFICQMVYNAVIGTRRLFKDYIFSLPHIIVWILVFLTPSILAVFYFNKSEIKEIFTE